MIIYIIAFLGFTGVALGAVGAHLLQGVLTVAQLGTFQTAVNYHQLYTVILLVLELARKHKALFILICIFTLIYILSTTYNIFFTHNVIVAYQSLVRYPIFFLTYIVVSDYITKNNEIKYTLILPFIFGGLWVSFSQWLYAYDLGISVFNTGDFRMHMFSFYGLQGYDQSVLSFEHEPINPNDIGGITALILPVIYIAYIYRIFSRKSNKW